MTYTILAIVVLVVVVLFVLLSRKPDQAPAAAGDKKSRAPEAKPKSIKPGPGPEAKTAEVAKAPSAAGLAAAEPAAAARSAPPMRDLAELRKGLSKARGESGFLGRLASLFAGKKELDPAIADQVEEILLTSDVGVATTQAILTRLREGLQKHDLSSSQAVWDALRAEAMRILGIRG